MLPDELERLAARYVPGSGSLDIVRLSNGLVNDTYRVSRDGNSYALRVAAPNTSDLGLDRHWEARVLERAVPAGLAPAMEYCDPSHGILISRWSSGRSWNAQDARRDLNVGRIAELLRRIHALSMPATPRVMSPMKWIDFYTTAAAKLGPPREGLQAGNAAALKSAAERRMAELAFGPQVPAVVCHSDLHILNLIDSGQSLVLLDWEYAHAADPFWDLAGWSGNNDYENALIEQLLVSYCARPPTRDERRRLRLLSWLYDYVCLLWCELVAAPGGTAWDGVATRAGHLAGRLLATASSRGG